MKKAEEILGDKFQLNSYKFEDLVSDREKFGRNYKKCIGSQVQPCVGADGHVYVCTNHRGWKQYSYGSLYEKSFEEIWKDIVKRQQVMHKIENEECFKNCTKLCKPHESNKAAWYIYQNLNKKIKKELLSSQEEVGANIKHREFI